MEIERRVYDQIFYRAEMFNDFLEFLDDHYLALGEIDEVWNKFEEWQDDGSPSFSQTDKKYN